MAHTATGRSLLEKIQRRRIHMGADETAGLCVASGPMPAWTRPLNPQPPRRWGLRPSPFYTWEHRVTKRANGLTSIPQLVHGEAGSGQSMGTGHYRAQGSPQPLPKAEVVASSGLPGAGSPSTKQGEPFHSSCDPALGLEEARDPGPGTLYVKTLGGSGPWQLEKKKVSPEPKLAELTV